MRFRNLLKRVNMAMCTWLVAVFCWFISGYHWMCKQRWNCVYGWWRFSALSFQHTTGWENNTLIAYWRLKRCRQLRFSAVSWQLTVGLGNLPWRTEVEMCTHVDNWVFLPFHYSLLLDGGNPGQPANQETGLWSMGGVQRQVTSRKQWNRLKGAGSVWRQAMTRTDYMMRGECSKSIDSWDVLSCMPSALDLMCVGLWVWLLRMCVCVCVHACMRVCVCVCVCVCVFTVAVTNE